jgi:hypothetical protein
MAAGEISRTFPWLLNKIPSTAGKQGAARTMIKRFFGLTLSAMLFALSTSAEAQQTAKVPRIGFLDNNTAAGSAGLFGRVPPGDAQAWMD